LWPCYLIVLSAIGSGETMRRSAERRCSVTRRQECLSWNKGAIGAFTAAAWLSRNLGS
jgi:hypothetical protein